MGLLVVIVGLVAVSVLAVTAARTRSAIGRGDPVRLTRRQVAGGVALAAALITAGLFLFPVVWWAFFPHCCNP